jgi:hypothetical protein
LQAQLVQKELVSLLQLGARTHSFESRSPVLDEVVDGWEDGTTRGGRVGGGSGKVSRGMHRQMPKHGVGGEGVPLGGLMKNFLNLSFLVI